MPVSARPRKPYRWRHNWIPRTPGAALVKAKGNQKLANRYMTRHGVGETGRKTAPRRDEGPYFRKTGPELRELAKKGDPDAQAELARRIARKEASGKVGGKRPGVPFRPGGDRPAPKAPPRPDPTPERPKTARRSPQAPTGRTLPAGRPTGTLDAAQRVREAREKYGFASPEHVRELNWQNELWTDNAGYSIDTKRIEGTSRPVLLDTQRRPDGTRVGTVIERDPETGDVFTAPYEAKLNGKSIGRFSSRLEAHRALDREHDRTKREAELKEARKVAKRGDASRRNAAAGWEPHEIPDDGSFGSRVAREKTKQAFKRGNTTVLVETRMTEAQTKAFLDDVDRTIRKSGLDDRDITFKVPTGDREFRTRANGGIVGAYVQRGIPTVHVNPKIASGDPLTLASFGQGAHTGHFMPAGKDVPPREYTLAHELGHVLDFMNGDTVRSGGSTPSGFGLPPVSNETAASLHREHRGDFSKYGTSSLQEGYAEAFAQWVHGGPGSSRLADAFARRFGWPTPRSV
jgi:hypothetical protein